MDPYGNPQPKKTSPWVYLGVGCGIAVLLGLIAISASPTWSTARARK